MRPDGADGAGALPDRLLGPSAWARIWNVHRNTARAHLRRLHESYGGRVVRRIGRGARSTYQASARSLAALEWDDPDALVTQEQLSKALSEVWAALRKVGYASTKMRGAGAKKS